MDKREKKIKTSLTILSILLLLALAGDIMFYSKSNDMTKQRNRAVLKSDSIMSLGLSHDKRSESLSSDLNACFSKLTEADALIKKLKEELELKKAELVRAQNIKGESRPRKYVKELEKKNADCAQQVNSLMKEITRLEGQVKELNNTIMSLRADKEDLKSKLDKYKTIKIYDIDITCYKNKRTTSKARKTNRVNISFLLAENELAESGTKEITLLVYSPDGKVISEKGNKFLNNDSGKEQVYSMNKTVNYANQDTKSSIDFECSCKMEKGKHKTELYVDGKLAGKKEFELK